MHYRAAHHHQQAKPKDQRRNSFRAYRLFRMSDSSHNKKNHGGSMLSIKLIVLIVLSLQNSLFTVLRRYSQGVLKETYSKYELLLLGEIIKIAFSAYMVLQQPDPPHHEESPRGGLEHTTRSPMQHFQFLIRTSGKMVGLAAIYGAMNILSFVSLRNIGAGLFTIFAQTKILTTAVFSTILLNRTYSSTKWRALLALSFGVLLFSEPVWNKADTGVSNGADVGNVVVGVGAVIIEVTLSGFASIYFEKVIKTDPSQLNIWERNFQLALGSIPVYIMFIIANGGGPAGFLGGWSWMALLVALLGAAGGLLVALSIKYGDAILKTLATTAAIIMSSVIDKVWLDGPLTPIMMIAGAQVIVAICNYTFDATPVGEPMRKASDRPNHRSEVIKEDEEIALIERNSSNHGDDAKHHERRLDGSER